VGIDVNHSEPGLRPPRGAVWLDGGRLEDRCWEHLADLLSRTSSLTGTWVGFSWWHRHWDVRCEVQRDEGYGGVAVRIDLPPWRAGRVCQAAEAVGGAAHQVVPPAEASPKVRRATNRGKRRRKAR
jgi:hypothetical protein